MWLFLARLNQVATFGHHDAYASPLHYTEGFLQEPHEDLATARYQVDGTLGGLPQLASVELRVPRCAWGEGGRVGKG